jgi:AcrR family transcriptional regulator
VAPSAVYWHFPSEADLRSAVLDAEYADMVNSIEQAIDAALAGIDPLAVAGEAYIAWGLAHPGAYQLLFESGDALPETRAENGPRLQNRIVELASAIDPAAPSQPRCCCGRPGMASSRCACTRPTGTGEGSARRGAPLTLRD